jgi:hypothetical protein
MPQYDVIEVEGNQIEVVEVEDAAGITVVEVLIPGPQGGGTGGGVGSGLLTPWVSDIDANGYNLEDAGYIDMREAGTPSAPPANQIRVFARDDGGGVTQLCVRFANGNVLVIGQDS